MTSHSASVPDISGIINFARSFLIRQAGLLDVGLELESFQQEGDHFIVIFLSTSLIYGPSRWTVELEKGGKVVQFEKQKLSKSR